MSKIKVPQELIDEIIDLYANKQYTRKKIRQDLNLPFGDSVILRILKENNISIRSNPGAQKGGRKKEIVPQDLQLKIIDAYSKGWGLQRIVKELQLPFSFDKVRTILKDNNIHIRSYKEAASVAIKPDLRKYPINDNYNLNSHNGAWLLGFLAADGYLPITKGARNKIVITLQDKDEEILQKIAAELNYKGPIYHFVVDGKYDAVSLSFTSKVLREKIETYGIVNNKTFKFHEIPRALSKEYILDFIRGFFDGDGSIYEPKDRHRIRMNFTCASKEFLQEVNDYLTSSLGLRAVIIHESIRTNPIYSMVYCSEDSFKLCKAFYENNFLALQRKKDLYFKLKKKYIHSLR